MLFQKDSMKSVHILDDTFGEYSHFVDGLYFLDIEEGPEFDSRPLSFAQARSSRCSIYHVVQCRIFMHQGHWQIITNSKATPS
jgi:hypothetical protein